MMMSVQSDMCRLQNKLFTIHQSTAATRGLRKIFMHSVALTVPRRASIIKQMTPAHLAPLRTQFTAVTSHSTIFSTPSPDCSRPLGKNWALMDNWSMNANQRDPDLEGSAVQQRTQPASMIMGSFDGPHSTKTHRTKP